MNKLITKRKILGIMGASILLLVSILPSEESKRVMNDHQSPPTSPGGPEEVMNLGGNTVITDSSSASGVTVNFS